MNIAAAIYGAIAPLIGDRAYPEEAPEGTVMPFAVYRQTDMRVFETIDTMASVTVLEKYLIDIWASTRTEAGTLATSVITAMATLNGASMPNSFEGLSWDFDPETGAHACSVEYVIKNTL